MYPRFGQQPAVPVYNIASSSSIVTPSNALTLSESTTHTTTSFNKENNAPYGESYSPLTHISQSTQLNPYSTRIEQRNILDEAQATNSELTKKNELLQIQLLEERQKNKGKSKKARKANADDSNDGLLRHLAHKFVFSQNLWTFGKQPHLVIAATQLPPTYDGLNRFKAAPAGMEKLWPAFAFKWELMYMLPPIHQRIADDPLALKQMFQTMQTFRSSLQFTVRREAAVLLEEFDELTKEDLAAIRDPALRETSPGLQLLIGFNASPVEEEPRYPAIPPILSEGGSGDLEDIFRNAAVRKLIALVLFGPSQMTTIPPNRSETCQASLWKVTEVTPGMIALAGTLLVYLISPDTAFTATGAKSGISYYDRFTLYKTLISDNIKHAAIKSLLRNLNCALFGDGSGTISSVTNNHAPRPLLYTDPTLERLMAQFRAPVSTDDIQNQDSTRDPSEDTNYRGSPTPSLTHYVPSTPSLTHYVPPTPSLTHYIPPPDLAVPETRLSYPSNPSISGNQSHAVASSSIAFVPIVPPGHGQPVNQSEIPDNLQFNPRPVGTAPRTTTKENPTPGSQPTVNVPQLVNNRGTTRRVVTQGQRSVVENSDSEDDTPSRKVQRVNGAHPPRGGARGRGGRGRGTASG